MSTMKVNRLLASAVAGVSASAVHRVMFPVMSPASSAVETPEVRRKRLKRERDRKYRAAKKQAVLA